MKQSDLAPPCGCGRSPTGKCIGWHNLTVESYTKKLEEWKQSESPQLLKEKKDDSMG